MDTKQQRSFRDGRHQFCPTSHAQADRLRAVIGAAQPDPVTLGGAAGSARIEFLDRRAGQAEAGFRPRLPADVKAGGLCRAPRPDQAPRSPGRMLPRQRADVEVDRREPVTAVGSWELGGRPGVIRGCPTTMPYHRLAVFVFCQPIIVRLLSLRTTAILRT